MGGEYGTGRSGGRSHALRQEGQAIAEVRRVLTLFQAHEVLDALAQIDHLLGQPTLTAEDVSTMHALLQRERMLGMTGVEGRVTQHQESMARWHRVGGGTASPISRRARQGTSSPSVSACGISRSRAATHRRRKPMMWRETASHRSTRGLIALGLLIGWTAWGWRSPGERLEDWRAQYPAHARG